MANRWQYENEVMAADDNNTKAGHISAAATASPSDQPVLQRPAGNGTFESVTSLTYFDNKKVRYIWQDEKKEFVKLTGLDKNVPCTYFYQQHGLSACEQANR